MFFIERTMKNPNRWICRSKNCSNCSLKIDSSKTINVSCKLHYISPLFRRNNRISEVILSLGCFQENLDFSIDFCKLDTENY